jgi:hypothetical protein
MPLCAEFRCCCICLAFEGDVYEVCCFPDILHVSPVGAACMLIVDSSMAVIHAHVCTTFARVCKDTVVCHQT